MSKELIKIITIEKGKRLVSARELHDFLEVGRDFTTWIKGRIDKYDFIESEDYAITNSFHQNGGKGGRPEKDYIITTDMAKELCMIENNPLGREARRYFIECEKKLQEVSKRAVLLETIYNGGQEAVIASKELTDMEVAEATKPLLNKIDEQETVIEDREEQLRKQKPIMDFAETVYKEADNILVREMAKLVSDEGFSIGEKRLYKVLREWGWILKGGTEPSQKAIDNNIFVVEEKLVKNVYSKNIVTRTTKVTGKGQILIIDRLRREGFIKPKNKDE